MMLVAGGFVLLVIGLLLVQRCVKVGRSRRGQQAAPRAAQMQEARYNGGDLRFRPRLCADSGMMLAVEAGAVMGHTLPQGLAGDGAQDWVQAMTADMIRQSMTAFRSWISAGAQINSITLLLTKHQLACPQLMDLIEWELDRQNLAPACLGIALHDLSPAEQGGDFSIRILSNLSRLATLGCVIELSDFGLGSLSADVGLLGGRVRIGRALIRNCDQGGTSQRMILAVLALAERRGMASIACDVSTMAEQSFLTQIGVDWLQGNVIGPPSIPAQLLKIVLAQQRLVPPALTWRQGR